MGIRPDGSRYVRFRPVPAVATPDAVGRLCAALREGLSAGRVDPLLVSMEFVLDFTCVHPFGDGNGRMSRLLTLLLLYRCGYMVGKYVSVEGEIERTKGDYYGALAESSRGWDEGENDPGPFVRYMLGTVLACYPGALRPRLGAARGRRHQGRPRGGGAQALGRQGHQGGPAGGVPRRQPHHRRARPRGDARRREDREGRRRQVHGLRLEGVGAPVATRPATCGTYRLP